MMNACNFLKFIFKSNLFFNNFLYGYVWYTTIHRLPKEENSETLN